MAATCKWGAAISACIRSLRQAALTPTTWMEAVEESSSTSVRPEAGGCTGNGTELCMNPILLRLGRKGELPSHHRSHRRGGGKHERQGRRDGGLRDYGTARLRDCD